MQRSLDLEPAREGLSQPPLLVEIEGRQGARLAAHQEEHARVVVRQAERHSTSAVVLPTVEVSMFALWQPKRRGAVRRALERLPARLIRPRRDDHDKEEDAAAGIRAFQQPAHVLRHPTHDAGLKRWVGQERARLGPEAEERASRAEGRVDVILFSTFTSAPKFSNMLATSKPVGARPSAICAVRPTAMWAVAVG